MLQYRLLIFDGSGHLFRRLDFDFETDQAAVDYASIKKGGADAELWRDSLLLGSFVKHGDLSKGQL